MSIRLGKKVTEITDKIVLGAGRIAALGTAKNNLNERRRHSKNVIFKRANPLFIKYSNFRRKVSLSNACVGIWIFLV